MIKDIAFKKQDLLEEFVRVRERTEQLCQSLLTEDYVIQSTADVSPPKWHLAHTTWFFESFLLVPHATNYRVFQPNFQFIFNSYYHGVGTQYPRQNRGLLSRPCVKLIYDYRLRTNDAVQNLLTKCSEMQLEALEPILLLGLQHEQQHQELLLMDIKRNFSVDPNFPAYRLSPQMCKKESCISPLVFNEVEGGIVELGHNGRDFCFDNELPRHKFFLKPYAMANRLVTNGEYLEFMSAEGYRNPLYWLADGWNMLIQDNWQHPLYWQQIGERWYIFTLSGLKEVNRDEPVSHVSYYEAAAFARWSGYRLPLEAEWEHYVSSQLLSPLGGNFFESLIFHPQPAKKVVTGEQYFGDLWEWTSTPYGPYPGFKPLQGVLGEYNGKFMNNQMVLRGGCCITPQDHIRMSYRNFFQPEKRWQFSGIRLAQDRE